MALRISILAIVLFAVVAAIAERRGTERDHEVRRRRLATRAAETERNAEAARSLVIAETGHELKTPLAVLRSALETLRDVGDRLTDEQRASAHATVWRTLERLEARTEAVLAASIERSSGPDTSPTTEFSALLADLLQDAGALLRPGALQLDLAAVGSVQVARVDLEHVIENLVVNAGKYGPQDGVVTVRSRVAGGGAVVIEVHDQGLTLTARDAAHIYEPGFRTTRATGVADGDGLGLALVERLVRGWGGEVRCDVNADGTTFAVTIPQA